MELLPVGADATFGQEVSVRECRGNIEQDLALRLIGEVVPHEVPEHVVTVLDVRRLGQRLELDAADVKFMRAGSDLAGEVQRISVPLRIASALTPEYVDADPIKRRPDDLLPQRRRCRFACR